MLQKIFSEYKQPFVLTYLGLSLMVIYLPLAIIKDWICTLMSPTLFKNFYSYGDGSSIRRDVPLRMNDMHEDLDNDLRRFLITEKDLNDSEEGLLSDTQIDAYEPCLPDKSSKLSSWEIAKCSLCLAPIWFLTEVK